MLSQDYKIESDGYNLILFKKSLVEDKKKMQYLKEQYPDVDWAAVDREFESEDECLKIA